MQPPLKKYGKNILFVTLWFLLGRAYKNYTMKKILTIIALFVAITAAAQKVRFDIRFVSEDANVTRVLVHPLEINEETKSVVVREKDGRFSGSVPVSKTGFYNLVIVRNQSQQLVPVYFDNQKEIKFDVKIDEKDYLVENSIDNSVLTVLNSVLNDLDRRLWLKMGMSGDELKDLILSYRTAIDAVKDTEGLSPAVSDYMKVMAYVRAFNAYKSIPRAQEISMTSIPFSRNDVLPAPGKVLDNDYTSLFFAGFQIIKDELP